MKRTIIILVTAVLLVLVLTNLLHKETYYNLKLEELKTEYAIKPISSVDHSKFKELQRDFKTPQDVTEACIGCHNERHKEVMNSSHWNWERVAYVQDRGIVASGKKSVINNFCIGATTNEQACAKCHIGFGMNNDHFDFNNARNVDCMVCHDNSDEYIKGAAMAGYPDRSVNLTKVAQSVGQPEKHNCGSCHFNSGGGNNVKHGDLEQSLLSCTRETDVHMAANGMNMDCVACHTAENHQIKGKLYSVSSTHHNRVECEQCHTSTPHFNDVLNNHGSKVACQTCHIPTYAKVNATKMEWKWSEAGKLKNGEPFSEEDEMGNHDYLSIKGKFRWEKNVKPEYTWFNGTADHYVLGDKIKEVPVRINPLFGSHDDPDSKIIPVKIHRGDQIYDKVNNTLIQPRLWAAEKGDSAFWVDFDWKLAAEAGMKQVGLPFSGEYGFIETEMYWPINHMVAPASEALNCAECHTRSEDGRLAQLGGFYLPGRDHNKPLDILGLIAFLGALGGVFIHAMIRIIVSIKNKQYETEIIDYEQED